MEILSTSDFINALILLLVAFILGFIIAWLLFKNRYGRDFRVLQGKYNQQLRAYNELDNNYRSLENDCGKTRKAFGDLQVKFRDLEANGGGGKAASGTKSRSFVGNASAKASAKPASKAKKGKESEAEVLERVKAKAESLDFATIGTASADEKDDLKLIKGIGPFIEKKLHALGIYTFRQVANFTEEIEDKVNEAIEFFPGRIRRDKWSAQAKDFADKKDA